MRKSIIYLIALLTVLMWSCESTQTPSNTQVPVITEADILQHITELSKDSYEGRKPFSAGEEKTLAYLEQQVKDLGLEPGNGDSYFQEVPMIEITGNPSQNMTIKGNGEDITLNYKDDFMATSRKAVDNIELNASELVFAGYGIVAPEYGWNDYEGLDVAGKTVVVWVNDPGLGRGDTSFFKGDTMTYYGRWTYKYEEAGRQGAAGCLIVHETYAAGYQWAVVRNSWSGGQLHLESDAPVCDVEGWITSEAAARILNAASTDMGPISKAAREPGFKPVSLGLNASMSIVQTFKRDVSQNVIAKLEGTTRPDEYVIYTAHWDHLGVGLAIEGDSIYNGALDNASGTSSVLSIAKAFTQMKSERSVVFLFVTAEEQGLLGSAYYAENPIYPLNKTVANLNIDGAYYYGPMKDLTVIGFGQSELESYAREVAEKQGRYIMPDPEASKGYYFRSDHFSFAKVGVPALYAKGYAEHMEKGKEYVEKLKKEYLVKYYHRPADEYQADSWDMAGAVQDAQLYLEVGTTLANETSFPGWKVGSEFKATRDAYMK